MKPEQIIKIRRRIHDFIFKCDESILLELAEIIQKKTGLKIIDKE